MVTAAAAALRYGVLLLLVSTVVTEYEEYDNGYPSSPPPLDYNFGEDREEPRRKYTDIPENNDNRNYKEDETDEWPQGENHENKISKNMDDTSIDIMDRYTPENIVQRLKSNRFMKRRYPKQNEDVEEVKRKLFQKRKGKNNRYDSSDTMDSGFKIEDPVPVYRNPPNRERYDKIKRRKPRDKDRSRNEELLKSPPVDEEEVETRDRDYQEKNDQDGLDLTSPSQTFVTLTKGRKNKGNYNPKINHNDFKENYDYEKIQSMRSKLPALLLRTNAKTTINAGEFKRRGVTRTITRLKMTDYDDVNVKKTLDASTDAEMLPQRRFNVNKPLDASPDAEMVPQRRFNVNKPLDASPDAEMEPRRKFDVEKPLSASPVPPRRFYVIEPLSASPDMSLAEQSRLSILRKAKLKENTVKEKTTKKPPVLLQVQTSQMETVVMVDLPVAPKEMALRALDQEDPKLLNKVKRIMRKRLMFSGKSMRELSANNNEIICGYVDTSELQEPSNSQARTMRRISKFLPACMLFFTLGIFRI